MNRQRILYFLLALGAVAIFVILLIQSQRVNENVHNQYRSDLRQLESLHAVLNEDVLRAKLGLLTYYDPLNETLSAIGQVRDRLGQVPPFVSDQGQREINDSLKTYDGLLAQQIALIERFKTDNSVLRNSLSYFTIVVSDLTNKSSAVVDPVAREALNNLLQDILLYNTTANQAQIQRIQDDILVLQQNRNKLTSTSSAVTVNLDVLIGHANIVVARKPTIDSGIDEMFALPISSQISQQSTIYDSYYEAARQSANLFQIALYIYSLLSVVSISAIIIASLRNAAQLVSKANQELQVTYFSLEKRSEELEVANVELQIATREAKEASRVKGEFLANISHELRTPLNAIIGFSDMLLMGIGGELNDNQQHKITRLRENGIRLLTLINNVLDLTRIEARRIELAHKPFDPRVLIERVTAQMEVLAQQKQLELYATLSEDLPVALIGDEQRVEQVIVNLLSNAFKFTEHGSVTVHMDTNSAERTWGFTVSDTGVGIPPHALDLIFEEFRQVDNSTSRSYKGSGLGLAITRNLVRVMDGQIVVKSELGIGSTFTVTLPLLEEANIAVAIPNKVGV